MIATAISPAALNLLMINQTSWTSEQYQKMYEAGVLTEDDQVELLLGKITEMSPIGRFHAASVRKLTNLAYSRLFGKYSFSFENPIELPDESQPEPDFALLELREDEYATGHPTVNDVKLIAEVADQTLAKDRNLKLAIYANANIPEYWIINLIDRQIEIYELPNPEKAVYGQTKIVGETENFDHPIFGTVTATEILP